VRGRLAVYRPNLPANLAGFPLFPFDEDDVRQHVALRQAPLPQASRRREGSITLRQLGGILSEALLDRMEAFPDKFDLADVRPDQVKGYQILLAKAVDRRVA
jgi:hypothetical protein